MLVPVLLSLAAIGLVLSTHRPRAVGDDAVVGDEVRVPSDKIPGLTVSPAGASPTVVVRVERATAALLTGSIVEFAGRRVPADFAAPVTVRRADVLPISRGSLASQRDHASSRQVR